MASMMLHSSGFCRLEKQWSSPVAHKNRLRTRELRIVCIGGDKSSREEAARKALEQALGGKKEAFSKWDDEIKKRETPKEGKKRSWFSLGGSGGGGIGDSGSGGGGGGGGDSGDDWNEAKQVVLATTALILFYMILTDTTTTVRFLLGIPRNTIQGIKRVISALITVMSRSRGGDSRRVQESGGLTEPVGSDTDE